MQLCKGKKAHEMMSRIRPLKHDALSLTIAESGFYIASRIASIFYLHLHMNRVHNINFTGKSWGSKSIIKYY